MATITFDTHEFVTELKNVGFSEQQAEAITRLQKTAVSSVLEQTRLEYDLDGLVTNQTLDARLKELELWASLFFKLLLIARLLSIIGFPHRKNMAVFAALRPYHDHQTSVGG
jgi:hypothetical protein